MQADLSLPWVHMSEGIFSYIVTHLINMLMYGYMDNTKAI